MIKIFEMKTINYLLLAGVVILLSAFTINNSINWKMTEDYSIKFSGTDAEGIFKTLKGDIFFDKTNLDKTKFSFSIDVNSINTGNGMKNKHAISDKWFDAEQYPTISFSSKKVSENVLGYAVLGNMNIHGVSKEMTIPFTFENNTFKSQFSVNRMDFNVGTMNGMSKKVSNEIKLDISIPVSK